MRARCATAGRTARAGSRSAPARWSTACGSMARPAAGSPGSTRPATATRAISPMAVHTARGVISARTVRSSKAISLPDCEPAKASPCCPAARAITSRWDRGREIGGNRPDVMADALVGGLMKAQSGGGDAGKVEIGVVVEERMNQQSEMRYQHLVRDEDIAIYPVSDDINNFWNGTGQMPPRRLDAVRHRLGKFAGLRRSRRGHDRRIARQDPRPRNEGHQQRRLS